MNCCLNMNKIFVFFKPICRSISIFKTNKTDDIAVKNFITVKGIGAVGIPNWEFPIDPLISILEVWGAPHPFF